MDSPTTLDTPDLSNQDVPTGEGFSKALEITAPLASPNCEDNCPSSLASANQVSAEKVSADLASASANSYTTQDSQNVLANDLMDFGTYSKDTQFQDETANLGTY